MERNCRDDRKTPFQNSANDRPAFERISSREIRIRGIELARQVLRGDGWRQAGFMADLANRFTKSSRAPVLFQEGEAHRKQRSATARFFAPKVVATRYRHLMAEQSARLIKDFRSTGRADLDSMGMELSAAVTAEIVGLTDSRRPGLANRLSSFSADKQRRSVGQDREFNKDGPRLLSNTAILCLRRNAGHPVAPSPGARRHHFPSDLSGLQHP
jgi:cytochrome P450